MTLLSNCRNGGMMPCYDFLRGKISEIEVNVRKLNFFTFLVKNTHLHTPFFSIDNHSHTYYIYPIKLYDIHSLTNR